ncbi:MAG TPA: DsbE family thiol:disulfide interchange protein [Steroidobacteraceae bacterium]|jgi:cytochrome c biogenesis protein CcmG/thiol:disulfide interchange protein DsbE|nr:DsbE family thiol:disulfide interchange protein [Steroidobacteraceae bacterium]
MSRFTLPLILFALLVVVLGIGIKQSPEKDLIPSPLIGKTAPQFSLPNLTDPGQRVSSAQLRGHWYLFNVWGTWCGSCRVEQPMLLKIRQSGLIPLVGLDWKDDDSDALSYLKAQGDPYQTIAVDHDGSEAIMWGVYGAPETFLVSPQGIVVYKFIGPITEQDWEQQILPRLPMGRTPATAASS